MFRHKLSQSVAVSALAVAASLVLLAGCSPKLDTAAGTATDAEIAPAIARCVAMQSGNIQINSKFSESPNPAMREQMEAAAETAAKKAREEHMQLLQQTCDKTVRDACKTSAMHCKKMYGG